MEIYFNIAVFKEYLFDNLLQTIQKFVQWEKNIKMRTKPIMATVEWFVFEVDMVENNAGYASPETPTGGRSLRFL